MSDSEDDYNSGEDGDYVPSGEGESEDDYDENDGKNTTFLPCWIDGSAQGDEEYGAKRKKRKKTNNRDLSSKRKRGGGIKLEGDEGNSKEEVEEEVAPVDNLTDELASIKEKKLEEKKKERADDLWNSFLKDVGQPVKSNATKATVSASNATASSDAVPKKSEPTTDVKEKKNTVTVTKIFDFAGEKVEVKKEVDANSKEAKKCLKEISEKTVDKPTTSSSLGIKRPQGGLGSILNKISKKPKIGTLEKSKLDWNSFKQREGIEDELKLHNKGKNGFLEKRDFLDRTNQRQYEIEKSFRLGLNKSTR